MIRLPAAAPIARVKTIITTYEAVGRAGAARVCALALIADLLILRIFEGTDLVTGLVFVDAIKTPSLGSAAPEEVMEL